jgi:hypothetical protein
MTLYNYYTVLASTLSDTKESKVKSGSTDMADWLLQAIIERIMPVISAIADRRKILLRDI